MIKKTLIFLLVLFPFLSFSQVEELEELKVSDSIRLSQIKRADSNQTILCCDDSELFVYFKGAKNYTESERLLFSFLRSNFHYPDSAKANGIEAKIYVSFMISDKGKVFDIKIVKGGNSYFNDEVMRVMALMPDWEWDAKIKHRTNTKRTRPFVF